LQSKSDNDKIIEEVKNEIENEIKKAMNGYIGSPTIEKTVDFIQQFIHSQTKDLEALGIYLTIEATPDYINNSVKINIREDKKRGFILNG